MDVITMRQIAEKYDIKASQMASLSHFMRQHGGYNSGRELVIRAETFQRLCDNRIFAGFLGGIRSRNRMRRDLDRIVELEERVYNLTLYLKYIEEHHALAYRELQEQYSGMPGYSEEALKWKL